VTKTISSGCGDPGQSCDKTLKKRSGSIRSGVQIPGSSSSPSVNIFRAAARGVPVTAPIVMPREATERGANLCALPIPLTLREAEQWRQPAWTKEP